MTEHADLDSHHIEGYRPDTGHLKIPLISEVMENLWVGGCYQGVKLPVSFKYVVSAYPWEQYELPLGCSRVEVRLYDGDEVPDEPLLHGLAQLVGQLRSGGKTLVHCQAGLNRSNLITALMLIEVDGMSPEGAIKLLREKRSPAVLCNTTFENWLRRQA